MTARTWVSLLRGALLYGLVFAVFPDWPGWRIFLVGALIGSVLVLTDALSDQDD